MGIKKSYHYYLIHLQKPSKNRNTAMTGYGMPTGTKIRDRTRTRVTRDCDTAVIPVPVMNPTDEGGL